MKRLASILLLGSAVLCGQLDTRSYDPLGRSIRIGRIQVIHSRTPDLAGTSMYLQQADPWLAYELGWYLFAREWSTREGLFRLTRQHPLAAAANSCAMCHNSPFHTPGAGGNFADYGGNGRKTRPLFGIGLMETIAIQVRQQIMAQFDTNHNGFLDHPAETRGKRAVVEAMPGIAVDFGPLEDLNGDGLPDLNDVIQPFLVNAEGRPVALAPDGKNPRLGDPGVAGYDIAVGFLSSSAGDHQMPTLRLFAVGVLQTVLGLPIIDEVIGSTASPAAPGVWATMSNAGAPQLYMPLGQAVARRCQYVSAGDLDLLEWFLLNYPAPAVGRQNAETRHGQQLMRTFGCVSCHVQDWRILPANDATGMPGDRRFFNLATQFDPQSGELRGSLIDLTRRVRGRDGTELAIARRDGFEVRGIYTDLRYHDVGQRFYEYTTDGAGRILLTRRFRTPPLWGVASASSYGHDGRSATLNDVIRRHAGEAEQARNAFDTAKLRDQRALIEFLESLVLYDPTTLPTDINGDGRIDKSYTLAGFAAGPEQLRPELLFHTPPHYRGWVETPGGDRYFSFELMNQAEVFGAILPALCNGDGDGAQDLSVYRPDATNSETGSRGPANGRLSDYKPR